MTYPLAAQEVRVSPAPPSGGPKPAEGRPSGGPPGEGKPGSPVPGQPGQPGGAPGQPGDPSKEGAKAAPAGPAPITRPTKPTSPARPDELRVKPNADGLVQLNFHGQKWLDVLEWYAEVSGMSLDWQEVPGDFLNLRTQRLYTLDEARDLLNRHLMDRGYTLLRHGEVLIVANLKKLDPALLPRVRPEDLAQRDPHEFVKTSFKLDWLIAESTVDELKPLFSPHGKVSGLKATNRLEAIDSVANLREVYAILKDEQSRTGQDRLVREYKLNYTRADEVYELLLGLLGQEKPKKDEGPMDPRQMMRMQQMMQQGGMPQQPGGGAPKEKPKVHLVVNRRENSLLANGPPDLIAIVDQAVKTLDVPDEEGQSLLQNPNRMQVYRLSAIDPEPLVEVLNQLGNLDPETQLKVDKKNKAIIAYAPLVDHVMIKAMVDKLDGTDRKFEVIKLRRLEADYVAGTIQFMMGAAEQKQQSRRSSYYFYDPFEVGSGGQSSSDESRKFRVDADVEHNRLLIWANDVELAEVQKLLVKLGEIPPAGARGATLRTIDSISPEDAPAVLERLRQMWPGVGDNALRLQTPPEAPARESSAEEAPPERPARRRDENTSTQTEPASPAFVSLQPAVLQFSRTAVSRTHQIAAVGRNQVAERTLADAATENVAADVASEPQAASETQAAETAADDEETAQPAGPDAESESLETPAELPPATPRRVPQRPTGPRPPVQIELSPDGRLTIQSDDTDALDRLEDLLSEIAPPRRDYRLFKLKHRTSWAYGIALNLEDFFKEQEKQPQGRRPWYYYDTSSQQTDDARRLSKRRALKFISDSDSNSILVVGADPNQMRIIEDLINFYDQPEPNDSKALRKTKTFQIRYSKAKVIGDAIKDVYRDLLSENDKALQQQNNGQNQNQQRASEKTVTYVYDSFGDSGSGGKEKQAQPQPVRFKGALSLGVDDVSNTLIVSATESLLENISRLVEELDAAARATAPTLQVLRVNGNVPTGDLQAKLAKVLKERRREQAQPPQQQPNQPPRPPQQPVDDDSPF